ncbi:MAG: hypothetical protein Q8Q59_07840 [Luteolibacter sp.]|jgi:hypothetical protein|nr:hypothetical protein [Luteolibacter sp.]
MKPSFNRLSRLSRIALAAATITSSHAATWSGTADGNWSDAANWGGSAPTTSGDFLTFNYLALPSNTAPVSTIDSAWATAGAVDGIEFQADAADPASANSYTLKLGTDVTSLAIGADGINSAKTRGTILIDQVGSGKDLFLDADQTWTVSGSANDGRIRVGIDLAGSGKLTKSGTGALRFHSGSSADWTGTFTLESGELGLTDNNAQYSRLGPSIKWRNNNSSVLSLTSNGTFASDIEFTDTGSGAYQFGNSAGTAVSVNLTGNYTGALNESLRFQADPNSGHVYRISGDNSGLTSSLANVGGEGAILIRNVFVYLDSPNALGTDNGLFAAVGENNNTAVGRTAGLLTTNGIPVTGKIKVPVNVRSPNPDGVAQEVTLGLDGTGSASFTGGVTLATTNSTVFKPAKILHLSAPGGGVVTFSGNIVDQTPADANKVPDIQIEGGGKVILSGINSHTAKTTVLPNTTLQVDNVSGTGTGAVEIQNTAILQGVGSISGTVTAAGTIAPGNGVGNLTVGATTLTGTLAVQIDGSTGDQLVSTGNLNITDSTLTIEELGAGFTEPTYEIVLTGGELIGEFASVTVGYAVEYGPNQVILTKVSGSDYDTWAATYLPAIVTNPAADLDNDGLTNQQEYAFGLNPTLGSSVNPITVPLNKTTGTFTYTRRKLSLVTPLAYTVKTSTDLAIWTPASISGESITTAGDIETVVVTLSGAPLGAPKLFVRVSAE